ncbi:MAG TPA: FecR domain-containing protein [Rhodocyclaceae bacterium]|nr:FecR domain-containing protein [Rhodocyclaceae bacterium]
MTNLVPLPRRLLAPLVLACLLCVGSALAGEDYRHIVRSGETLIGIGADMLQNPGDWTRVKRLNNVADEHRLRPGSVLRIPVALMRLEPVAARITAIKGDVRAGGTPVAVGNTIGSGSQLSTGEQSFATIELVDGSRLVLQPSSRLKVEELARYRNTDALETRLRLDSGRIESIVTKTAAPRPKFTVTTPTATIGVRGTEFRVGADDTSASSRTEVTEGTVGVTGDKGKAAAVPAGFGVVAEAGGKISGPVALLPPPELGGLPKLQDRTIVRFGFPPVAGAGKYRVQVGSDAEMRHVLAESLSFGPEAKFADLPDGDYTLRVRGVDARSLEGRDADFAFKLKARPEPPFAVSPVGGIKLRGESAELSWAASTEAARYRVQLANDAKFANLIADIDRVDGTVVMPARRLPPGEYYWRARSIRTDGDAGPWGDPQRFTLKPLPADPEPPKIGDQQLAFAWSAEPGQTFLFQFARDAGFVDLVTEQRLDQASTTIARPDGGTYFMRVRATDADGFVGPFTSPQKIDVPIPPPPWWLLLMLLPAVL